jgi:uncharacterized protein YydD (DUF2326 family)
MKLSRLYTNKPTVFSPIEFNEGLSVILARVNHPMDAEKHSHCLGKSLLISVIDFGLLCTVGPSHFLNTQAERFQEFVFFLEIQTHDGAFVTVRRSVAEPTKIAFKRHAAKHQDFTGLGDEAWDHVRVAFKKARTLLDSLLGLTTIKPWHYRKGVTYFLRSQHDYLDVFQLAKYGHGRHLEWKPYLARIIGLNDGVLKQKYETDDEIKRLTDTQRELQSEVNIKPKDFEKLKASIAVKQDEVGGKVSALDRFDFHSQEVALASETADQVERQIAENNTLLYNALHDLSRIEGGLQDEVHFDIADVKRVFEEASITFPDQLARDYSDLVAFSRRILTERREQLEKNAIELREAIKQFEAENQTLSERRRTALQILGGTVSLQKYKDLQRQLDKDRASLALMEEKAEKLGKIIAHNDNLSSLRAKKETLTGEIARMVGDAREQLPRYRAISQNFSRIIKEVLHRTALFYVVQNGEGNIDFKAEYTDAETDGPTEEDRGNTFKQVLCIAFDLAVLIAYAEEPFFHFVYHDGGLEQKQSKMKLALLQVIRATCRDYRIQYILSALDEDLPTVEDTQDLCPTPAEIVLELHDGGDDGRLFKMPRF